MKARFMETQPAAKVVLRDGIAYVFICINEQIRTEDCATEAGSVAYIEYDYNEFAAPVGELDLDDIKAHPEEYINYIPDAKQRTNSERIADLEEALYMILEGETM